MTTSTRARAPWSPFDGMTDTASRDEFGELARCCWDALLAGRTAGYVEGHTAGRESVYAGIEADVAQVVGNAVKSVDVAAARRRPYEVPGSAR